MSNDVGDRPDSSEAPGISRFVDDGSRWDAIVVGSGMGGITAAAYLAANGRRTLVVEAGETIGGCTHVFRREGFEFEVGVHYLGSCGDPDGNIPTVLAGVGLDKRIDFREIDPTGFDVLHFASGSFAIPRGWDAYEQRLVDTFSEQERALRRYIRIIRRLATAVDLAVTPAGVGGSFDLVRSAGFASAFAMMPLETVVRICGVTGLARAVVCGQTPAYASPARRAPAIVQAGYLQTYVGGGAWFPVGGGQVLSARLADVVLANGGTVAVDSPVAEILVDHAAVQGVRLADGTTAHAPVVVSSADLKKTFRELVGPEHLTSREIRRVDGYRMAWPLFNVYIGLDCDLSARFTSAQHWRFRFDGDFGESQKALDFAQFGGDREAWLEACRTYLGGMIHIATAKDPVSGLAPPGMSSIEVMTYVPPDPELWGIDGYDPTVSSSYRASEVYRYMKQQVTEILVDVASDVIPDIRDPHRLARERLSRNAAEVHAIHWWRIVRSGDECRSGRAAATGPHDLRDRSVRGRCELVLGSRSRGDHVVRDRCRIGGTGARPRVRGAQRSRVRGHRGHPRPSG